MNLETSARSLLEQFPSGERPDLDRREQRIERFGSVVFTGFMVVVGIAVLGLLYVILDRMVFSGQQIAFGILLMAFIVFALLTLVFVVFREDLKEKRLKAAPGLSGQTGRSSDQSLETPAVTGRLIEEGNFEPIPSVTENTTNLLPTSKRDTH